MNEITIATRASQLALWQANEVKRQIIEKCPNLIVNIKAITTKGDKILDRSLQKIGGKGLFIKELEFALINGEADIAVHSLKDVPHTLEEGFSLSTIMQREEPRDAFVSKKLNSLTELQNQDVLGSSSLRRIDQLTEHYSCTTKDIRGNINTRLEKLTKGEFDALILAAVGLERLGLEEHIKEYIPIELSIPSPGQGALGIEILSKNLSSLSPILEQLDHKISHIECNAERKFFRIINGNCQKSAACFVKFCNKNDIYTIHYFYKCWGEIYRGKLLARDEQELDSLIESYAKKAAKILNLKN